ncbi:MAG TPA: hypothetical protein PLC48_01210 [Ferruginibacter sp.]|nr:hypothetical protein [Ferruginibacter sp.]
MIIEIDDTKIIGDVQDKFNEFFPYLQLEFYHEPHHWYEGSEERNSIPADSKLGEVRKIHEHGDLEIHSWTKTGDLEEQLKKHFGLFVQVLRRQGDEWLQTIRTDKLSLHDQNELGRKTQLM